jgi:hypothetical protein
VPGGGGTGGGSVQGSPPAAGPDHTRLQISLSTSSAWTTLDLLGASVVASKVVRSSAGSRVSNGPSGFAVSDSASSVGGQVSFVVDMVYAFDRTTTPVLRLCKGSNGAARADVARTTTGTPTDLASVPDPGPDQVPADDCPQAVSATVPVTGAALAGPTSWPPRLDPRHLVLGFYYPWYDANSFDEPSAWVDTPAGPWNTDDPTQVAQMVSEASTTGMNGFIVSYNTNPTLAARLGYVAQAASGTGFTVSPLIELGQMKSQAPGGVLTASSVERAIEDAVGREGSTALEVGRRPAVFLYDSQALSPALWGQIHRDLSGMNPFVVADTTSTAYGFDGIYSYSPNVVSDDSALPAWDAGFEQVARFNPAVDPTAGPQRLWAAPTSPGEDDSKLGRSPQATIVISRAGSARYDHTWQAALASEPEWTLVSTWNEWYEATNIAPGVHTGTLAIDRSRNWAGIFQRQP